MRNSLLRNDRGLSPFAGILLVLLTTFLMVATAAMFLGGIGDDNQQHDPPSSTLTFDYAENTEGNESVTIHHNRGQKIHPGQMDIVLDGARCTDGGDPNGEYNAHEDFGLAENNWMGAGMSLVIDKNSPERLCDGGDLKLGDASIEIIWRNPSGTDVTLETWASESQ